MAVVSPATDSESSLTVSAALCVDGDAFDRLGRALRYLAVGLFDQSIHLRLLSSDPRVETLTFGPIQTVMHQHITWPWTGRRITKVLEAVAHQPPGVVHALSVGSYRLAAAIADVYDADLVLQVTSLADCDGITQLDQERIGGFLAVSKPLVQVLEEQLKTPAERIGLVRPGIPAAQRVTCFDRPDRVTTVLCTSPFERNGGVDQLIEATSIVRQRGHDMLLFLLGRGRREPALRRMVRERGLASSVAFAHPLGDLAAAMESADLFVRPAAAEAFTVDSLQAMASGMAVISFPNAICDYLRNGETAVICAERTAESLANAIEKLVTDQGYARQIAGAGMDYARNHHAMSGMAERTAAVYRKLALARATFPIPE